MVHSEHGWRAAHPRESVSALLILCTCLAWETAASTCPGKQPGAGAPGCPCGPPNPAEGIWGSARGPRAACAQGPSSILAFEIFSASICPRPQAGCPVFPRQRYGVSCLYPSREAPGHPSYSQRQRSASLVSQRLPQAEGRLCLRQGAPGLERSPTPRAEARSGGAQAGKTFSSFPQICLFSVCSHLGKRGPAPILWPWRSWVALPQHPSIACCGHEAAARLPIKVSCTPLIQEAPRHTPPCTEGKHSKMPI